MEAAPENQKFVLVNVEDLIEGINKRGVVIVENKEKFFEKLREIHKKIDELELNQSQVRFFYLNEKFDVEIASEILREIYVMAESILGPIGGDEPLKEYSDERMKKYTQRNYIEENVENGNFEIFPIIFERAFRRIKIESQGANTDDPAENKRIIEAVLTSASPKLNNAFIAKKQKTLSPMVSPHQQVVREQLSFNEKKLFDILSPMLDPDPNNRPSLEAVMLNLVNEGQMKNEKIEQYKENILNKIKKDFVKEELSVFADELSELGSSEKEKDPVKQKYKERRDSHTPIVSSLYNKAKKAGRYFRDKKEVRKNQLIQIKKVGEIYSNNPTDDNFRNFYSELCQVEENIRGEGNIFQSGLKQLCRHYRRELAAINLEQAKAVEKEQEPKKRFVP